MRIISYIDLFIGATINILLYVFIVKKVFNKNLVSNTKKVLFGLIVSSVFISLINIFNRDTFKILLTFPFVAAALKYAFGIDYRKAITYSVVVILYTLFSEIMAGIVLSILPIDYTFISNNILGTTIGAIIVVIFAIPLLYTKELSKIIRKFDINAKPIIILLLLVAAGALGYKNVINSDSIIKTIMNTIITASLIGILYMYYNENEKSKALSDKYNEMFFYLEKYEKELVEKRKIIHDYKNQLIIINGYVDNKKELKKYMKELLEEQRNIPENSIIKNIDKLPQGIKGLIYYKFSHMEDQKINVNLEIKSSLNRFNKANPHITKQALKIIGILIDNSIEAVSIEKTKYIDIEFSIKNNIFKMKIINPCNQKIKISDVTKLGFSTKGKNRGYGLALANEIIKEEKDLDLNIKIENKEFIAELKMSI